MLGLALHSDVGRWIGNEEYSISTSDLEGNTTILVEDKTSLCSMQVYIHLKFISREQPLSYNMALCGAGMGVQL